MATDDWTPLPSLWPEPAASRTIGEYELLVFTQEGVPTWEVRYDVRQSPARSSDLIAMVLPTVSTLPKPRLCTRHRY